MKKRGPRAYVSDTCGTLYKSSQEPRRQHTTQKKMDRMKMTTRRRKDEIKNRTKITHPRGKREKKVQARQGSNRDQEIKKEWAFVFADFRLARFAKGVEQRQQQNKTSLRTPPLRTPGKQKAKKEDRSKKNKSR